MRFMYRDYKNHRKGREGNRQLIKCNAKFTRFLKKTTKVIYRFIQTKRYASNKKRSGRPGISFKRQAAFNFLEDIGGHFELTSKILRRCSNIHMNSCMNVRMVGAVGTPCSQTCRVFGKHPITVNEFRVVINIEKLSSSITNIKKSL